MELGGAFSSGPRRRGARCPTAPRRGENAPTLIVRAELIRYLRRGLRGELAQTSGALQSLVEIVRVPMDVAMYRKTLARFDGARALLDSIGPSDGDDVRDLELDVERWRGLGLSVLAEQYEYEATRLEAVRHDGYPTLARRHVHGLAELVAQLRDTTGSTERAVVDRPRRLRGSPT